MINDSILENLSIHNINLSVYYIASVLITVLSIIITWWYQKYSSAKLEDSGVNSSISEGQIEEETSDLKESQRKDDSIDENIMSHIKKRHSLAEEVAANLTQQQLEEEMEVEKQQLEAIFQLLQNQQEKYQVSSMEELEDQLRLYR
ncbi:matrix-remodeling-associated protein 7-like [Macrosteles quadrilineatus]|uniref:matrix-remodeling-associated protein 7-like n=1 Tax=Macrosteles quadrilineatus TaxID=74068 RepID=UPI0023E2608A|nr:matrix-remodeling-associated protein 7-like [Macrosteles quadrilineatus]